MKKKLIYIIFFAVMISVVGYYSWELVSYYTFRPHIVAMPPPTASLSIGAEGIKAEIGNDIEWNTIAKLVTSVLSTFLGYRLIKKYI